MPVRPLLVAPCQVSGPQVTEAVPSSAETVAESSGWRDFQIAAKQMALSSPSPRPKFQTSSGWASRVTPHTFRRSCTTEMLRGGANVYHVKEMLGHESLDTLKHYARLTITDLKKTHAKCHPREKND